MMFGTVKGLKHATIFILIIILLDETFKYGNGAKFKISLGQTLTHSMYNTVTCAMTL
jgi:hypothetical protein